MKLKKLAITVLAATLIMGTTGIPTIAAGNPVNEESILVKNRAASSVEQLRQKKKVLVKEAWTETVNHPEEGHTESQLVKEAWTETINHPAEYKDVWVVDKEAVYEQQLVSPEISHIEKVWVETKPAWDEQVLVSPEESHIEQVWVVDKEAWTETINHPAEYKDVWVVDVPSQPIYKDEVVTVCFTCGTILSSDEDVVKHYTENPDESVSYGDKVIQVITGYTKEEGHYEPQLVKDAWTETINHPEEGHYEDQKVVDKEAVYETVHHEAEGYYEDKKVIDQEAVYEDVLVSPEEGHYEQELVKEAWTETINYPAEYKDVYVVDKEAWVETIEHPAEYQDVYVYTDPVAEFVNRLYTNLLQREADDSGLVSWTEVLKSGREQGVKVAQGFIDSNEFKSRTLSDTEYVKILYRTFLGREADTSGLNSWLSVLDSGLSRMHVFKGFAESAEFTKICQQYGIQRGNAMLTAPMDQNEGVTQFVARCYELCLGRKADTDGLNAWCSQILTGANTAKQAAYGFVFSDEFKSKNLSDEDYVRTLYRVFMDREADGAGLAAWINVLKSGQSREHVFNGFADSPEFQEICAGYGL